MSTRYPGGLITKNPVVPTTASAKGIWTLEQATEYIKAGTWPLPYTPIYIEEVFSTYLYTGNGSTQTITNGIDLSGNGGLVWIKRRDGAGNHALTDTARGASNNIYSDSTFAQGTDTQAGAYSFLSNGFDVYSASGLGTSNRSGATYVSWTFRKQAKFFDVVTYTGNGTAGRTISHSLGSVPGCVIYKQTSASGENWGVYHRSLPANNILWLNTTNAQLNLTNRITALSSADVTIGNNDEINANGASYVMYLFAHNAGGFGLTGTDNVISCGSFSTDASANASVSLGYEPQWVLIKRTDGGGYWDMLDNMRGMTVRTSNSYLWANTSDAEMIGQRAQPFATGFNYNGSNSATYIYIAIRRGPMKVPTSGTSVFYANTVAQANTIDSTNVPFPPDLVNTFSRNGTDRTSVYQLFQFVDRLRGLGAPNNTYGTGAIGVSLISSSTNAEETAAAYVQLRADSQNIGRGSGWDGAAHGNWIYYFMRRAPGFFDVVCYTGTGVARTVNHNLAAVPEMIVVKRRDLSSDWSVYCGYLPIPAMQALYLNLTDSLDLNTGRWNNTAPSAAVFSISSFGDVNASGSTYVAYLFATCPGVSKVGSYTGTGTTQTINCGFTGGARFVLIKRTDSTGDWYVWDTARGIVSGNDPYLLLNSTAAEVTNTDYIDTASSGFEISSTAPAAINANGGTFIFLAIA